MINGRVAARVLCAIVDAWKRGQSPLGRAELCARFDLGEDVVEPILRRLRETHLIISAGGEAADGQDGYVPARPPRDILLSDVLTPFRGRDILLSSAETKTSALDRIIADIESSMTEKTKTTTLDDLTSEASE